MLTPERIKELSDRHLRVVGAGYVRPQDAEEFARAIESEVRRLHAENADRAASAPADSVLEDAARYRWLFDARTEAQVANVHDTVDTPLPQDEVLSRLQGFYMSKAHVDAIVDAARKQGANHD